MSDSSVQNIGFYELGGLKLRDNAFHRRLAVAIVDGGN